MSEHHNAESRLYFAETLVALLQRMFCDQGTWFADYALADCLPPGLADFVDFSKSQLSEGEFDEGRRAQFDSYITSNLWFIESENFRVQLSEAPLFRETDLSFLPKSKSD